MQFTSSFFMAALLVAGIALAAPAQKVGIGTTNPGGGLHIRYTEGELPALLLENATGDTRTLLMVLANAPYFRENRMTSKGQLWIRSSMSLDSATNFALSHTNPNGQISEAFSINFQGQVGIGVSLPNAQLHVNASTSNPIVARFRSQAANSYITVENNASLRMQLGLSEQHGEIIMPEQGDLRVKAGDALNLTLKGGTGRMGLGIENPQQKLHVAGVGQFTEGVVVDAGGVPLNLYRENGHVASISAGGEVVVPACAVRFVRVGKLVTITLPDEKLGLTPVLPANEWRFNLAIPQLYRPQGSSLHHPMQVMVNGNLATGMLILEPDGTMLIRPSISSTTALWTGIANAGFFSASVSFLVVN
ncbi:MAG: hypothetical protein MUF24_04270 [Chitinophagaceae bacterium]|jgi:hypothetical protein|nr:hypothetical protein [Chitinophagaceae bacterium]